MSQRRKEIRLGRWYRKRLRKEFRSAQTLTFYGGARSAGKMFLAGRVFDSDQLVKILREDRLDMDRDRCSYGGTLTAEAVAAAEYRVRGL
jgi:hypothetical protein